MIFATKLEAGLGGFLAAVVVERRLQGSFAPLHLTSFGFAALRMTDEFSHRLSR
jgi:hypothetical protein